MQKKEKLQQDFASFFKKKTAIKICRVLKKSPPFIFEMEIKYGYTIKL